MNRVADPTRASFSLRGRNPDVLTCIANLSNDEVFTPPEFANRMLDTLAEAWAADHGGANLWADRTVKFLDPCAKSGVFLREITSRLTKGLDKYRACMLADKRLRNIVDYPKLYEGFPGVKIRGGISYFLWDRNHNGPCTVQTIWDAQPTGPAVARHLDAYDILIRRNEAVPILGKVRNKVEPALDARISSRKPFELATNFKGKPSKTGLKKPVQLFQNQRIGWVERTEIPINSDWIDEWKVLMTAVQGTSAAVETKFLSKPIIAEPGTACTETYLVAGHFDNETTAANYAKYLRTRFVRFFVSLRKATQHATRDVYAFVPDLPLDQEWTDAKLYKRYGLTKDEIAFIESQIAAHDSELFDDEPIADDGADE